MAYGWSKARLAALVTILVAASATLSHAEEEEEEDDDTYSPISWVIFGSMDASPSKGFGSTGAKRAIGGSLADSGYRLFVKSGFSREETRNGEWQGATDKAELQALVGYEWRIGNNFVAVYAGYDSESERSHDAFNLSPISSRYGARLQADLWAVPADRTMLHASGYISSINGRLWARLSPGWQMPAGFYVGPEIEAYRERDYSKLRLGLHHTNLRLLGLSWRLSGGWQTTSDRPAEAYATLGLYYLR